jgi:hypothetical protein
VACSIGVEREYAIAEQFEQAVERPRVERASFVRGLKRVSCPVCSQPVLEAAHGPLPGLMGGAREAFPGCA